MNKTKSILMPTPCISVIMSVYNGARFLREAVDSILQQSFTDFEFIIVDDASTDETQAILAGYGDKRIRLLRNTQNVGLTISLNRALVVARGRYIARMDADDISLPKRFEQQVEHLDAHQDVLALGTSADIVDARGVFYRRMPVPVCHEDVVIWLLINCSIVHGSVMFRNRADIRYNESFKAAQDYDLWVRLLETGRMANLPEVLYLWRDHAQSVTSARYEMQSALAREIARRHLSNVIRLGRYDYLLAASILGVGLDAEKRERVVSAMKNWAGAKQVDGRLMRRALYSYPIAVSAVPALLKELMTLWGVVEGVIWLCSRYGWFVFLRLFQRLVPACNRRSREM